MVPFVVQSKLIKYSALVTCGFVLLLLLYQQLNDLNPRNFQFNNWFHADKPAPKYAWISNSAIHKSPTIQVQHDVTVVSTVSSSQQPQRRLPQCIIIGQRKAGTKALITFLNGTHPDIVTPRKETHFFDKEKNYRRGLVYYRSQMPTSEAHQITMEKTPAYFFTPGVPERIKQMNESIKLILIVRDPVKRMISEYLHFDVRARGSKKTFQVNVSHLDLFNIIAENVLHFPRCTLCCS